MAVVEAGSFAAAAERLHKTQSTISYAIRKIEQLLDIRLFTLEGRRSVLTGEGAVLYRRGVSLIDEALRVERAAATLAAGWEAELRIAVDVIFPTWQLLDCMAQFGAEHPDIRLELFETVLDGTNELLLEGRVDIAITSMIPQGFLGDPLMQIRSIAVAAPSHALHQLGRPLTIEDLRPHRHILIRDSGRLRTRTPAWQGAEQRWTVSHKATSIHAVCMGLGFAWFPEAIIRRELADGTLKPLPVVEGSERWVTLYLIFPDPQSIGPGARELSELLQEASQNNRARPAAF